MQRPLLVVSLIANLALGICVIWIANGSSTFEATFPKPRLKQETKSANEENIGKSSSPTEVAASGLRLIDRDYFRQNPKAKELAQLLHEQGWPQYLIQPVIQSYVARSIDSQMAELVSGAAANYWDSAKKDRLGVERRQLMDKQFDLIKEALAGIPPDVWATKVSSENAKYGKIDSDKVRQIERIESDYMQQERAEMSKNRSPSESYLVKQSLEKEKAADLKKVLSDSEYQEYIARSSEAARLLQRAIIGLDIDEGQYRALFQIQHDWSTKYQFSSGDPLIHREAMVIQRENLARFESILGEEKFSKYLSKNDSLFKHLESGLGDLGQSQRLQVWRAVSDADTRISKLKIESESGRSVDAMQAGRIVKDVVDKLSGQDGSGKVSTYLSTKPSWLLSLETRANSIQTK